MKKKATENKITILHLKFTIIKNFSLYMGIFKRKVKETMLLTANQQLLILIPSHLCQIELDYQNKRGGEWSKKSQIAFPAETFYIHLNMRQSNMTNAPSTTMMQSDLHNHICLKKKIFTCFVCDREMAIAVK